MSALTNVEVVIDGKVYTLSGYEGADYLQRVAAYINAKINEFDAMGSTRYFSTDMKSVFIQLNIADDYFKAREQVERLEHELRMKEKELYDFKHDLVSSQIQMESAEARIRELEMENRELLLHKSRLETALEEALLEEQSLEKKSLEEKSQKKEESLEKEKKVGKNKKLNEGFHVIN